MDAKQCCMLVTICVVICASIISFFLVSQRGYLVDHDILLLYGVLLDNRIGASLLLIRHQLEDCFYLIA
jgi:hypothetical protein